MKRQVMLWLAALLLLTFPAAAGIASEEQPADYDGMRAGVITGSFHDSVIAEELPASAISQYNNCTDLAASRTASTGRSCGRGAGACSSAAC